MKMRFDEAGLSIIIRVCIKRYVNFAVKRFILNINLEPKIGNIVPGLAHLKEHRPDMLYPIPRRPSENLELVTIPIVEIHNLSTAIKYMQERRRVGLRKDIGRGIGVAGREVYHK